MGASLIAGREDGIHDSYAMRKFIGIHFFEQDVPDATTLPHFRHLLEDNAIDWERYIENQKSSVRRKAEHPYRIVKNIFGSRKAVYRELRKNLSRLHVLFASANLYMLAKAGGSLSPA